MKIICRFLSDFELSLSETVRIWSLTVIIRLAEQNEQLVIMLFYFSAKCKIFLMWQFIILIYTSLISTKLWLK